MIQRRNLGDTVTVSGGVAQIDDDNPGFVIGLDYNLPDRIYAFISPELRDQINGLFAKNPGIDAVSISASLSCLVSNASEFFEDDREIDKWIQGLQSAIEYLNLFKKERRRAMETTFCQRCIHALAVHSRPHNGEMSCHQEGCSCSQFAMSNDLEEENVPPRPRHLRLVYSAPQFSGGANSHTPAIRPR